MGPRRAVTSPRLEHVAARLPEMTMPANFLPYSQFKLGALYTYDLQPDMQHGLTALLQELQDAPSQQLQQNARHGITSDSLTLAVRLYIGCGVPKDIKAAYTHLLPLTMRLPGMPFHVPRPVEARANSVLAAIEYESATANADEWNIDALLRAAQFANNAAALGFVSPYVLNVARSANDIGARNRSAWRFDHPFNPGFAPLEFLWGAYEARLAEMDAEDKKQEKKITKNPTSYRCASPSCGITVTKKATLLKCSGGCPPDQKAHYCSPECQKEDWKRHKVLCKPGKPAASTSEAPDTTVTQSTSNSNSVFDEPGDGKERAVEINDPQLPGGKIKVSSKSMSAAALRTLRDSVEEKATKP